MQTLLLATLGGAVSCAATSLGALLSFTTLRSERFSRWRLPIDFALGLMVSAAAFSLIGPTALQLMGDYYKLSLLGLSFVAGVLLVVFFKHLADRFQPYAEKAVRTQVILAVVLMVHNFPEGLASGTALAGLKLHTALPVLASIALQNIPEGLLMVFCLKSLGTSTRWAFFGGIGSGLVELFGGMLAGLLLQYTDQALPFLLTSAGSAMLASVAIELWESGRFKARVMSLRFALGIISIPILNSLVIFN